MEIAEEYSNLLAYVRSQWRADSERDAEDIVQDVVLNLFSRVDFSSPIENVVGYLYRSLKNKIIDLRRKKKLPTQSIDEESEMAKGKILKEIPDPGPDQIPLSKDEVMQRQLIQSIDLLNQEHQSIIYATEFEGYTFQELSEEWEIPIGTLLARKHRAMARLQKIMSKYSIEKTED